MPDGQNGRAQHTLSTQFPETHCEPEVHSRPVGCGCGVAVGVEVGGGVAVGGGETTQTPDDPQTLPTGHALVLQHRLSVQNPDWHCAALVHMAPKPSFPVNVGVGVGRKTPQPFKALLTAASNSSMVIRPSPFASPARHVETGVVPSAMFTIVSSSLTLTTSPPLHAPTHSLGCEH